MAIKTEDIHNYCLGNNLTLQRYGLHQNEIME